MRLLTALTFAFSISFAALAEKKETEGTVKLRKVDDSKVQLIYGVEPESMVTVKIFDSNNSLIHADQIKSKKAFSKAYDFSKLIPGKYQVGVFSKNGEIDHLELNLENEKVEPIVYSKLEKQEGNKYRLLVNALLPTDMTVDIYENNVLIYSEQLNDTKGFKKTYIFANGVGRSNANIEFYLRSEDGFSTLLAAK